MSGVQRAYSPVQGGFAFATGGTFANVRLAFNSARSLIANVTGGVESEAPGLVVPQFLAAEGGAPSTFANLFPEDTVGAPLQTFQPEQIANMAGRRLNYVVTEDGQLVIGRQSQDVGGGHIDLAGGQPVQAAGEVKVVGGEIKYIDNSSGHYLPSGQSAQDAALNAFRNSGFNVPDSVYVEKVWDPVRGWIQK